MGLGIRTRFDRWQRARRRGSAFARLMRQFDEQLRGAPTLDADWLGELIASWDNEDWVARPLVLQACYAALRGGTGDVLECGSGLSTIVLQAALRGSDRRLFTLEHDADWATRTRTALRRCGLRVDGLHVAPLKAYEGFDWYDVGAIELPPRFDFVLVDGPPGGTRGNRSGLLHVLGDRLDERSLVLLDDANRSAEQRTLRDWQRLRGVQVDGPLPGQTHAWVRFPTAAGAAP